MKSFLWGGKLQIESSSAKCGITIKNKTQETDKKKKRKERAIFVYKRKESFTEMGSNFPSNYKNHYFVIFI